MLSKKDKEDIAEAFASTLQQNRYVPEDTHRKHHDYIELKMGAEEKRKDFWDKLGRKLVEQGVIRAFWLMITLIVLGALAWFKGLITWPGS